MSSISKSETCERLRQYRVDFAYSKNLFFAAANRVKMEMEQYHNKKRWLEITSIIIDVLTLSSIAVYFSDLYGDRSILIIGLLSVCSIGISIFLLLYNKTDNYVDYLSTANNYLALYKRTKNLEAKVKDNLITIEELSDEIDDIHTTQFNLSKANLATTNSDYQKAKKGIEEGESAYTGNDLERT